MMQNRVAAATLFFQERFCMIQAIFLDVDGTMVSFKTHKMTETLVEALHILREKGIKLFVSTGRHKSMLEYVNSQFSFDGYITLSGQYCYVGNEVVHHNPLSPEAVEEMLAVTERMGCSAIFLEGEKVYTNYIEDKTKHFVKELDISMPEVKPLSYGAGHTMYQVVSFLTQAEESILDRSAPHVKYTRWHPDFLDVIPPIGGKDKGVAALLNHFNISPEEAMAFGDGENDSSMLSYVKIGVAMGTASDAVKQQADYVTGTVDEDGIVTALNYFGLL